MRSFGKMLWMEIKLFAREPMAVFFTIGFPLLMLFLFGSIYGNEPTPAFNGKGTVDISIPAYTALIIATGSLMSINITMAAYREKGILRRLRATSVNPLMILAVQVIVMLIMTVIGMLLLMIAGKIVYHVKFEGNIGSVMLGFILSCLSFFCFGFILAGMMPTARVAQIAGLAILYPMTFLSGAGFPRELLPETIKKIGNFLPLTYVVNLLKGLWFGESWTSHLLDCGVLLVILILGTLISIKTFKWE
jgi:ABC-2 type transport system permease protein